MLVTKTQAQSLLLQIDSGENSLNLFKKLPENNKYEKWTLEQLEEKLGKYLGDDLSAVVDDPVDITKKPKM